MDTSSGQATPQAGAAGDTGPPPAGDTGPGPGSLLWRYAGDRRLAFVGLTAGILQLMHPAIGAGVAQHSAFFEDPWERILRSIPQIIGVVYGDDPEALGRMVRDRHRAIRGRDEKGRRYDATDPSTFWWAHATFQNAIEQMIDRYDRACLTPAGREDLYEEGVGWYRRYGMDMAPVPPDRSSFEREWERHCREVLEMTPAAERVVDMALHGRARDLAFLPAWTRRLQPALATPLLRLSALGGLPPTVRARFAIPWSGRDERAYGALRHTVASLWARLPPERRYGMTAAAAWRRHGGAPVR